MIRSTLYLLRKRLWDWLRYSPGVGKVASRILSTMARFPGRPEKRLHMLGRAARLEPTPARLAALLPRLEAETKRIDLAQADWPALGDSATSENDLPKALILKPPISEQEKGFLYVTFERQWLRLIRSGQAAEIAKRYELILGPSTSPPPQIEMLLLLRAWPGRIWTMLSNFEDAPLIERISPRLKPLPVLASSWVDPAPFERYLSLRQDYDLVMLAHFDSVKRHWLFFDLLRKLPHHLRVLLMGVPLGGRTEADLRAEAAIFGVENRFDLWLRPSREQIMEGLARSRASLIFSKQEGACIAIAESLFADTPVGVFRDARIGSRAFINAQTGRLLERATLARDVLGLLDTAHRYRPRHWAKRNISCHISGKLLNRIFLQTAIREGTPWTVDLAPFAKGLLPYYLTPEVKARMAPWGEDFLAHHGLQIGPLAANKVQSQIPVAA